MVRCIRTREEEHQRRVRREPERVRLEVEREVRLKAESERKAKLDAEESRWRKRELDEDLKAARPHLGKFAEVDNRGRDQLVHSGRGFDYQEGRIHQDRPKKTIPRR